MSNSQDKVLVVGAGITGIACAQYLTQAGYKVTVIDQGRVGDGCSQGNCGVICPSHILPLAEPAALMEGFISLLNPRAPFRLKLQPRLGLYRWMWQFIRRCSHRQMIADGRKIQPLLEATLEQYRQLFKELGPIGEWKESGLLHLFQTERSLDKFQATNNLLSETYGLNAERIEGGNLSAFDPAIKDGLAGGYLYSEDGSVRPDALVHDWANHLSGQGVVFIENCRMEGIDKESGSISGLITSHGKLTADRYIFAVGAWSESLSFQLECKIPVEPGKGYSVTMRKPGLCPKRPIVLSEHKVFLTPFETGYRLGSMMEFSGFDSSIPPQRIDQLRNATLGYLNEPKINIDSTEEVWSGWRPMTWDSLPIIGRVPALDNALLATGHNMLGVTLAPVTGRLIAELVDECKPHIDTAAFSPDRFQR